MTQSFSSGSTIFGDSPDDTHQFTGSILIGSGSISGSVQSTGSFGVLKLASYNQGYSNQNNTYFGINTGKASTNQKNVGV